MWLMLALGAAFFDSSADVIKKITLNRKTNEFVLLWLVFIISSLLLIPIAHFFPKGEKIDNEFFGLLALSGLLKFFSNIFYIKALKKSEISLVLPIINFTPLFLLITSPLMLGEKYSWWGLFGVIIIVFGSYLLKIDSREKNWLAPIIALFSDRGVQLMLLVSLIWGIISNIDKMGVKASSSLTWVWAECIFMSIVFAPIAISKLLKGKEQIAKKDYIFLFFISLFSVLSGLSQMTALGYNKVPYVISAKRTNVIMSVLWGGWLFKEKDIGYKIIGSLIMLIGVIIIVFAK